MPIVPLLFLVALAGTILTIIVSHAYLGVNLHRLLRYLEKTRYERWSYIKSFGNLPTCGSNPFRAFRYIWSDLDNDDDTIVKYKNNIKISVMCMLICVLAVNVEFALLLLFAKLRIGVT